MSEKRKVLCLLDSPTVSTGFANVARNILKHINDTGLYDITVIGINHTGDYYDQTKFPYKIYPAMPQGYSDMYGRGKAFQVLQGKDKQIKPPFDIFFTIQDHFIIAGTDNIANGFNLAKMIKELQKAILENKNVAPDYLFNWIGYYPVDGQLAPYWVKKGIAMTDYPVAYTVYGAKEMLRADDDSIKLKDRLTIIPHGVDTNIFKPLPDEENKKFRKEFFNGHVKDDTFLIVNVNRNQPRKDIPRTIKIFAEYKKINPKAFLYLHMKQSDSGGEIWRIASQFGLKEGTDMASPDDKFTAMYGFPIEKVNQVYNAADCILTTSLGEGWGFINTEAMAAKKPIIAAWNTAIPEIFGEEDIEKQDVGIDYLESNLDKLRGIPLRCGEGLNDWLCYGYTDNSVIRPLASVTDGVKKLGWVYNNPDKVKQITSNAYEYVQTLTWDKVCEDWTKLFDHAYNDVVKARNVAKLSKKIPKETRVKNRKERNRKKRK